MMNGELSAAQIGSLLLQDDGEEELLGGAAAKKEREIIESNRVKLTSYIHDVTTLFPLLRQEGIFNRDDVEIIEAPVTTTAKVDKCLDVLLRKGPKAIGVFHEALSSHYLHLFNYLAQLFTQAGLQLPESRQMKDEEEVLQKGKDRLDIRHSRSYSTYRNGSRSVTVRKRLEVMSRQCEMMEKEKDDLQQALSDREHEISSLLSTKEYVQTSLNNVQGKYQELLSQLAHWRTVLESDDAVKEWMVEREGIQREYDQMEQEYNLQCSELNAARERISLLLQQLERSEQMVSITQENCQKEKDILKHKIAVSEGEIQRLLGKLDYVITSPTNDTKVEGGESPEVRCEKLQRDLERTNDQICSLKDRLEVMHKECTQAYDERDKMVSKLYEETKRRKSVEKENKQLKTAVQNIDSVSNHSDTLNSPQTPQKLPGGNWAFHTMPAANSRPSEEPTTPRGVVKVESREIFMPAPNIDADLGMKLELCVVVKELREGSLPHLHGVRIGDEICQVNKFTLSGDKPLEFFNRLLFSATQPVTLTLRRQVLVPDPVRQANTLPAHLPIAASSPLTNRPVSPSFLHSHSLPLHPPTMCTSSLLPLSPQLPGTATLSNKSLVFHSLPPSTLATSPVIPTAPEMSLDGNTARVSTVTSNSTQSTNKDSTSSSSSDEDGERLGLRKRAVRAPVLIQQRRTQNRLSADSEVSGIVGSPTDRTGSVWKDNRLTRISTIDSGFEFPFTDELSMHEPAQQYDEFGNENRTTWEILEPEEVKGQESNGERGGEGEVQCCGEMRGRCNGRGLDRGYSGPGPRRQKGYYKRRISKSLDDLNENENEMHGKRPVRRPSRDGVRVVTIIKEEFQSQITLIGGRGYGMFIETDSKKHAFETGDKILEIGDKSTQGLTRAEVVELIESYFSKKEVAPLTVLYDSKALSQLPPNAKDNFYVRCTQPYRPPHSILSKSSELAFEKGDILHITNTLPAGHQGFWQAQKVGSKGETLAAGLVPVMLSPELTEDSVTVSLPQRIKNIGSPKLGFRNKTNSTSAGDDQRSTVPSAAKALNIYRPVRRLSEAQDLRPVVLLGALQRDIRKLLVNNSGSSPYDIIKFCFSPREEEGKCEDDEVVEKLQVDGKNMVSTTSHIKQLAQEGYHCVLCIDAEGLYMPGLQSLVPIVLFLHASATRVINKIRQRLTQDMDFNAQDEIDYVDSLRRYRQYFTGQIDLQNSMSEVVKEIRMTVARQQKSIIWENDS